MPRRVPVYIWDAVNAALAAEMDYVDLLRGEEPNRIECSSWIILTPWAILVQRRADWATYAEHLILRIKARGHVRSEDVTERVKSARCEIIPSSLGRRIDTSTR